MRFVIRKTNIVFGYKVFDNITFRVVIFTSTKDIVTIAVTNVYKMKRVVSVKCQNVRFL